MDEVLGIACLRRGGHSTSQVASAFQAAPFAAWTIRPASPYTLIAPHTAAMMSQARATSQMAAGGLTGAQWPDGLR